MPQASYPPPPWQLNATAYVSVWSVALAQHGPSLDTRIHPLAMRGRSAVATGFVSYEQGGDLQYDELFVAVLTRSHYGIGITIPLIWVDSSVSLLAGRELWGIPKELASFQRSDQVAFSARTQSGEALAAVLFDQRWALPWRQPIRLRVIQPILDSLRVTRAVASGSVQFGRASWDIPEHSPLSFLRQNRPLFSFEFSHARICFGA
jgi:hypothetical protein